MYIHPPPVGCVACADQGAAHALTHTYTRTRGDFAGNDDAALGGHDLYRAARGGVFEEEVVEDGVGDQIAQLVRVADTR